MLYENAVQDKPDHHSQRTYECFFNRPGVTGVMFLFIFTESARGRFSLVVAMCMYVCIYMSPFHVIFLK